jgi:hypothetical protein
LLNPENKLAPAIPANLSVKEYAILTFELMPPENKATPCVLMLAAIFVSLALVNAGTFWGFTI